jgi:hypothetical protein
VCGFVGLLPHPTRPLARGECVDPIIFFWWLGKKKKKKQVDDFAEVVLDFGHEVCGVSPQCFCGLVYYTVPP